MVKGSAFPLIPGKWRVTTGVFTDVNAMRVFEETVIIVLALDDTTATYTLPEGIDVSFGFKHKSITVLSGEVSIADNSIA